jgi:hypothetical protein
MSIQWLVNRVVIFMMSADVSPALNQVSPITDPPLILNILPAPIIDRSIHTSPCDDEAIELVYSDLLKKQPGIFNAGLKNYG